MKNLTESEIRILLAHRRLTTGAQEFLVRYCEALADSRPKRKASPSKRSIKVQVVAGGAT